MHRYVDEWGERHTDVCDHDFALYLPKEDGEYKNIYGQPLKKRVFESPNEMRDFVREYQDVIKINGMTKPEYQFIADHYPDRPLGFDFSKINIVNIDIETEIGYGFPDPQVAEQAINAITVSKIGTMSTITWTTCDYNAALDDERSPDNKIILCGTERELITNFLSWWNTERPDAICGWNIEGFDLVYMVNRFSQIVGSQTNMLSPIHEHAYRPISKRPNPATGKDMVRIEGLAILDYLELFKKFDFSSPPDYKLETIAQQVIGEGKVDYGEYDNLKDFYQNNPTKFIRYNIKDVLLVNKMDNALNFLLLAYTLQYWSKCNTQDIFGQVKFWDIYIFNFCQQHGLVIPPSKNVTPFPLEGAYVAEPKLGRHKWLVSFDLTSLYPRTLQQYNMGPETIIRGTQRRPGLLDSFIRMDDNIPELQEARQLKAAIAANGAMFSREQQSVLSMVVDELFNKRVEYKTAMKQLEKQYEQMKHDNAPTDELTAVHNRIMALDAQQMAMKIAINSLYGALGNEGFRYYDPSIAEAITQSGQLAVQFIAHRVSEFLDNELGIVRGLDRWLYSDTDSVAGSSIIPTSVGDIPIEDLFTKYSGRIIRQRGPNDFICEPKEVITTPSVNSNSIIEHKLIKYIMAHKVQKRMFRIKCNGDSVIVTEDHSVIVMRGDNMISCKPADIKQSDKLIKIDTNIELNNEFVIEDLGVCEMWVYDIEVEDNHNFFANNILVHNSCYFTLDDFVDKITQGNEDKFDRHKIVDAIDAYCKNKIEPFIASKYQELADYMNAYQNKMSMKREVISDRGMFRAKKNYVLQVYDNEGVRYENPKLKTMGVETARSTTPQFVKDALLESYREMLNGTNQKLLDKIASFKLEYMKQPVDVIATPRGVNDMGKWIDADGSYKNRIPYHVRASHEFNRLIREAGLNDIPPIQNGDKVRIVAIVPNSPVDGNYIAYNGSQLPKELDLEQYVDRESLFTKTFLNPVESFTKHMGWKHIDEFSVDDFFS